MARSKGDGDAPPRTKPICRAAHEGEVAPPRPKRLCRGADAAEVAPPSRSEESATPPVVGGWQPELAWLDAGYTPGVNCGRVRLPGRARQESASAQFLDNHKTDPQSSAVLAPIHVRSHVESPSRCSPPAPPPPSAVERKQLNQDGITSKNFDLFEEYERMWSVYETIREVEEDLCYGPVSKKLGREATISSGWRSIAHGLVTCKAIRKEITEAGGAPYPIPVQFLNSAVHTAPSAEAQLETLPGQSTPTPPPPSHTERKQLDQDGITSRNFDLLEEYEKMWAVYETIRELEEDLRYGPVSKKLEREAMISSGWRMIADRLVICKAIRKEIAEAGGVPYPIPIQFLD